MNGNKPYRSFLYPVLADRIKLVSANIKNRDANRK